MQEIIRARRTIRRFTREPIPAGVLQDALEAARLSPTGTNAQPLRFVAIQSTEIGDQLFPLLHWAGYIPDGSASPTQETRPTAYVVILIDTSIRKTADNDAGAAAMSIMLSAQAHGVASCWLASVDRPPLAALLQLDTARYAIHTVIALGYPAQESRAVAMAGDSTRYYLEAPDKLCVPKRDPKDSYTIL